MEFACDLISLEGGPSGISPRLSTALEGNVKVDFASGERIIRLGDYLGNQLAMTLSSPHGVPAASVFCWDEGGEFGTFRETPPSLWLASGLEGVIMGDWRAEGYGFTLGEQGVRIARWAVWDEPAEVEAAHTTYQAISPIVRHSEGKMKETDLLLVRNLTCRDPGSGSAAAFIAVAHESRAAALVLVEAVKGVVGSHLLACSL